jgi:hypothetical protein
MSLFIHVYGLRGLTDAAVLNYVMYASYTMRSLFLLHITPPLADRLLSSLLAKALIRVYSVISDLLSLDVIC